MEFTSSAGLAASLARGTPALCPLWTTAWPCPTTCSGTRRGESSRLARRLWTLGMFQRPTAAVSQLHPDRDGGDGLLPGEVSPVWPGASQQDQQQETLSQESGGHQGGLGPANQISSLNCQQLLDVTSLHCTTVLNKMSRFHNGIFQSFNNAPSSFDILPSPIDSTEERSGPHPSPQTSQLTGVENQPTPTSHPAQAGALFNCL